MENAELRVALRLARSGDAGAISALIGELMPYMTVHPDGEGAEAFKLSMLPDAIAGYIAADNIIYQIAFVDGELAGVVAMRDQCHVFHLFVAPAFHGRGLGRMLWQSAAAQANGNTTEFTVNSSLHAVPVYERFGFVASAAPVTQYGIAYLPMVFKVLETSS